MKNKIMKNKKGLSLKIFEWGLFGLVFSIFVAMFSPLLPTKNYFSSYTVASGSMEPTVLTGSIAFVKPIHAKDLKSGDIISFLEPQRPNTTILHRIQSIKKANNQLSFVTKGDANNARDNWVVNENEVKGKLLFTIPYIGYLSEFMRKPLGFILLIGIPALLLIFMQIKMIRNSIEHEVERRTRDIKNRSFTPQFKKIELMLFLVLCTTIFFPSASALLTSTVSINGMTIKTKETFADLDYILGDHKVKLRFSSLNTYAKVEYKLNYKTDNSTEEIDGEENLDGDIYQKDLLLGTCSQDGCTYDQNPHDFTLTVTLTNTHGNPITRVEHF